MDRKHSLSQKVGSEELPSIHYLYRLYARKERDEYFEPLSNYLKK